MNFVLRRLCIATIVATFGCQVAVPVAGRVASLVGSFLLNKAMESLWDSVTKKPVDVGKIEERLQELELEVMKVDGQYVTPIKELREKINPNMSWEEYRMIAGRLAPISRG